MKIAFSGTFYLVDEGAYVLRYGNDNTMDKGKYINIPNLTTIIAVVFSAALVRRYRSKGGTDLLWWAIGTATYALGTAAGIGRAPSSDRKGPRLVVGSRLYPLHQHLCIRVSGWRRTSHCMALCAGSGNL